MLSLVPILAIGLSVQADTLRSRWTLAEYLAVVEAVNPELIAARERMAAADARIGPARRPADPMVELGLMNRSLPGFGRNSPVAMDQIRVAQMLPTPGKLGASTGAARERASAAAEQFEETRRRLRWRAAADLIELDRLDRVAALLASLAPALRGLEDVARSLYTVGEGQQADVLRAQLESARLTEELVSLRGDRRAAVARLNALALRAPDAPIDSVTLPRFPDSLPPLDQLVDRALRWRPVLAVHRATQRAAAFDRRRAALDRWPDFEVGMAYGQQPMFDRAGTDRMLSLSVGATVPIWSGSRQRQVRREAEAMERMAAADFAVTQVETQSRVAELAADADRATALLALYSGTLLPQSRIAAASALASYQTGRVDFDTVIEGQVAVIRAELETIRFAADRQQVLIELEYLTAFPIGTVEGGSQ